MKKIIRFLIIILVALLGLYLAADKFFKAVEPSSINGGKKEEESFTVKKGDLAVKISATGLVQPKTKVNVIALKRGRINEVLVDEGDQAEKGQILAWMSSEERIALVDTASASLEEAKKSYDEERIKKAGEELEIAQNTYKLMPLVAPIDGVVILRGIEPGQTVSLDKPLFILADVLVVVAQVDEVDIGKVKIGQSVNINTDAFPAKIYKGKVTKIAYEANVIEGVTYYDITTDLLITDEMLKSGMTANVEIVIVNKEDILLVPKRAVMEEDGKSAVLVKTEKGNYEKREVKTGLTDRKDVEILEGVTEGEKIIIEAQDKGKKKGKEFGFKADHIKFFRK